MSGLHHFLELVLLMYAILLLRHLCYAVKSGATVLDQLARLINERRTHGNSEDDSGQ